jgi:cytosine/adenosine deaminase-related metal-dependent hydrolase
MTKLLIRGARVLDLDGDADMPPVRDILIDGERITGVGPNISAEHSDGADVIEAHGKLAIPGLVNSHYHSNDILARGMMEDLALDSWSMMASPLGSRRSLAEVRARTLVGAIDCLRNGITTVQDFSNFAPASEEVLDTILDAYADVGIRVVFSVTVRDKSQMDTIPWIRDIAPADMHAAIGNNVEAPGPQMDFVARQIKRVGDKGGMLRWALSPSAPQRCSPQLLEAVATLSKQLDLPVYTHVYETRVQRIFAQQNLAPYGGSAIRMLEACGLLGPNVSIAHGVWPEHDEIELIGDSGTNVVLNMLSNLKLKSGVAPVMDYRAQGVNLALGCDNCSCSDVQSLLQVMKLFCLLTSVSTPGSTGVTAKDAFRAATLGGARAAGLQDSIGAIRPGYKADIVLIDLADIAYVPFNSAIRQLVFADSGRAIDSVIVNGRLIIENRQLLSLDEAALREEIESLMPAVRTEFARLRGGYEQARPYLDEVQKRAWAVPLSVHRHVGAPQTAMLPRKGRAAP